MVYRLHAPYDIPALAIQAGDVVRYDPSDPIAPYSLHRAIDPDPGAILSAFMDGKLQGIDINPSPAFASSLSDALTSSPSAPRPPRALSLL